MSVHVCIYVYVYVCVHVCIYVYVYVCACVFVYIHYIIYLYRYTHKLVFSFRVKMLRAMRTVCLCTKEGRTKEGRKCFI